MKPEPPGAGQANNIAPLTAETLGQAVELLRAGEVIGLPTETVYGLAGDGLNPAALARIFEVKQRPLFDPLILHFADAAAAFDVAEQIPTAARELAERFWPGPLTIVLRKLAFVPDLATSGLPHVAIRVPEHPAAQAVLRAFGGPLAAPSANRFGRISPTDAQAVQAELGAAVPLILDGGHCTIGLESTVILISEHPPVLLRAGGVPLEAIEALIGRVDLAPPVNERPQAPGQLRQHYAPRKPLRLAAKMTDIDDAPEIGWLAFGPLPLELSGVVENVSPAGDLKEAAAHFFSALRRLDDDPRVKSLVALPFPEVGLGRAINERLVRAAS